MRTVAIESPFKADTPEQARLHQEYLERVIRHELRSGNAPFASHALYTRYLDDDDPEQRQQGIEAGLAITTQCDDRKFYCDHGFSSGMLQAFRRYQQLGLPFQFCFIGREGGISAECENLDDALEHAGGLAALNQADANGDPTAWVQAFLNRLYGAPEPTTFTEFAVQVNDGDTWQFITEDWEQEEEECEEVLWTKSRSEAETIRSNFTEEFPQGTRIVYRTVTHTQPQPTDTHHNHAIQ